MEPRTRWYVRLTRHLHPVLISDPERVALALLFLYMGLASLQVFFVGDESGIAKLLPSWSLLEWAVTWTLGGLLQLIGMFRSYRLTERVGMMLSAFGCASYGLMMLVLAPSARGIGVAVLFLILSMIKVLRLIVSSAAKGTQ